MRRGSNLPSLLQRPRRSFPRCYFHTRAAVRSGQFRAKSTVHAWPDQEQLIASSCYLFTLCDVFARTQMAEWDDTDVSYNVAVPATAACCSARTALERGINFTCGEGCELNVGY